jgi:hypothetical protein
MDSFQAARKKTGGEANLTAGARALAGEGQTLTRWVLQANHG